MHKKPCLLVVDGQGWAGDAVHVQEARDVGALGGDGNGQCGQKHPGGHPLHLLLREVLAHLQRENVEAMEGASMEENISTLP